MSHKAQPPARLRIRKGDWIVVCDGSRALVLENQGDSKYPNLRKTAVHEHKERPTHELGVDAPGRIRKSYGTARSAVEQTDWHEVSERKFLLDLVDDLEAAVTGKPRRRLIIVAPPRALGILRDAYSPVVRAAISAELDKDWVKLPLEEIEKRLFA